ncbi:MAG: ExbD/TolR family protein [Pseudomonadota bacterium]
MQTLKQDTLLSEINVTPFVDVMLVLLIIFMVTAPMMIAGLDVDLPDVRGANLEVDESKLMLVIDRDANVLLDDVPIPKDRLEEVLLTNERIKAEKEVYLKADESLPYGVVVKVMGLLREAGVIKLGMVTNPMDDAPAPSKEEGEEEQKAVEKPGT